MTILQSHVNCFSATAEALRALPWFTADWSCCSGLWKTDRYPDTLVIRLTKRNWSSVFPITLHKGGEIQYAAWIDSKLLAASTVRFEMHLFAFPTKKKIKKARSPIPSVKRTNPRSVPSAITIQTEAPLSPMPANTNSKT